MIDLQAMDSSNNVGNIRYYSEVIVYAAVSLK